MGIEGMLAREDFYKILSETVVYYYKAVNNLDIEFSYKPHTGCEKIVINKLLSFIASPTMCPGLYEFLNSEYNIRNSFSKYILGKSAIHLVKRFPFIGRARNAYITGGVLHKNEFINPQNRSVRFFDYDNQTVNCVIKKGFTDKFFNQQLNFRKYNKYDFILPLLAYGDRWFREPILRGNCLARVTNKNRYKKGFQDAFKYIGIIVEDTLSSANSDDYCDSLAKSVLVYLNRAKKEKRIKYYNEIQKLTKESLDIIHEVPIIIPTALTHGDLQTGNIWVDKEDKTWIYDWETVGRRSVWYDASVLGYSLRRPYGWRNFVASTDNTFLLLYDHKKDYTEKEIASIKRITLMEDLIFYLEDMLELPRDWGGWIFDNYCERILPLFNNE